MFNIFDIGIILLLVMFLIVGFKRGVIKEVFSLVGIILVFFLSFAFKGYLGKILCTFCPFLSFTGSLKGMDTLNILIYQVISFMILFVVFLTLYEVLIKISKVLQKIINATIILIIPSKILGVLVSLIKGYLILFIAFLLLMIPIGNTDIYKESKMVHYMMYETPVLAGYTSNFTKPMEKIYSLGERLSKNEISTDNANKEALEIMLDYKVVNKEMVESLIRLKKIKSPEGIEELLEKY